LQQTRKNVWNYSNHLKYIALTKIISYKYQTTNNRYYCYRYQR